MEFKPKNREWVKNAAIIFLAVLLVLTFFSNTFMNRSLPEVATEYVTSNSITAKVRGKGTVTANGSHQVKAEQDREIRAVMVKAGQQVNAGDVLFVLGEGSSEELEAAQESLRQLQVSYQRAAISAPTFDYSQDERKMKQAEEELTAAQEAEQQALEALKAASSIPESEIKAAEERLSAAQATYAELSAKAEETRQAAQTRVDNALAELERLLNQQPAPAQGEAAPAAESASADDIPDTEPTPNTESTPSPAPTESPAIQAARKELADAQIALETLNFPELTAAKNNVDRCQEELDRMLNADGALRSAYDEAVAARKTAEDTLFEQKYALQQKKQEDDKSQQLAYIDLADIAAQMELQKKKIRELSGGEENEITANVSGTVQTVECTAGDMKVKGDVLCTIEVPDMGYTLSFSVTNEQARRLHTGDTATVSNYYWGSQIVATLSTIKIDPKNPQTNKLLTFDLTGDVNAGAELTISVGEKSANYDTVVPNSAIRSDSNGSFVYIIEAKNSPLGNRYIARRADVEVLASDDVNSAVTGSLNNGDYVITTSNAPVNNGDMVRMADS